MLGGRLTHRLVGEERVEGVCRHVFLRSGDSYVLADLVVYADGAIECGATPLIDLAQLRERLRSGAVLAVPPDGARIVVTAVAECRVSQLRAFKDEDMLLGDVVDDIDRLNKRPDSIRRCLATLRTYLADPTESHRVDLRERYLGIPQHRRRSMLRAMDPGVRILISDLGSPVHGDRQERLVTPQLREEALAYLRDQFRADDQRQNRHPGPRPR